MYKHILYFFLAMLIFSCDNSQETQLEFEPDHVESEVDIQGIEATYPSIEFKLVSGKLDVNGSIHINSPNLYPPSGGAIVSEVIALIDESSELPPELLRIEYTGHHVEWIGSRGGGSAMFDNEDDCMESGLYCQSHEVGTGTSGIFDSGIDQLIGVQVIMCRDIEYSYNIPITAAITYIGDTEPIVVSNTESIVITCNSYSSL